MLLYERLHITAETCSQRRKWENISVFQKKPLPCGTTVRSNRRFTESATSDSSRSCLCFLFGRAAASWVVVAENIRASSFTWNMSSIQCKASQTQKITPWPLPHYQLLLLIRLLRYLHAGREFMLCSFTHCGQRIQQLLRVLDYVANSCAEWNCTITYMIWYPPLPWSLPLLLNLFGCWYFLNLGHSVRYIVQRNLWNDFPALFQVVWHRSSFLWLVPF